MRIKHAHCGDLQRVRPITRCTLCDRELYHGTGIWQLNGQILCRDCLMEWLLGELAPYHSICGEAKQ